MKKSVIFIVLAVVLVGIGIFYFSYSQFSSDSNDSVPTSLDEVKETGLEETEKQIADFEIFNPTLTYDNSYNGPLYATSEQIGDGYDIDKYMSNLDRNGVNFFIGMFPILGEQNEDSLTTNIGLGYVINNVKKYPHRIIPFFNPGFGGEEIEDRGLVGDELTSLYRDTLISSKNIVGDEFIKGFGEVETQEWSVRHNAPGVLQLTDMAYSNNINFMFHPVASKIDDVEFLIEKYPNMNFIIHMFREDLRNSRTRLIEMMKTHDNLYFSIDAAHIINYKGNDILYDYYDNYGVNAASNFLSTVNSNYDSILNGALSDYKPLVDAVPDKVMWGTEAGPDYSFEPEVYDLMVKISREFIFKVTEDSEVRESLGYKNALGAFGQGAVLNKEIIVADTSSWTLCTDEQIEECEQEVCETGGGDDLTPEEESCFNDCLFKAQCTDPLD